MEELIPKGIHVVFGTMIGMFNHNLLRFYKSSASGESRFGKFKLGRRVTASCRWTRPLECPPCGQYSRLDWQLVSNDPFSNSATVLVVFATSPLPCTPKNLKKTKNQTKFPYVMLSSLAQSNLSSFLKPSLSLPLTVSVSLHFLPIFSLFRNVLQATPLPFLSNFHNCTSLIRKPIAARFWWGFSAIHEPPWRRVVVNTAVYWRNL